MHDKCTLLFTKENIINLKKKDFNVPSLTVLGSTQDERTGVGVAVVGGGGGWSVGKPNLKLPITDFR